MRKRICFIVDSIFSFGGVQRVTAVIAKELAKDYDVTIFTFDKPTSQNTTLYELSESSINYHFFSYPSINKLKRQISKVYSGFYRKMKPQGRIASNLYACSSFPSELRQALIQELRRGQYDTIIGVHAPLAARLATLRPQLKGVRCIGWIHNSYDALFSPSSTYIGPQLEYHYAHQMNKLDHVVVLCQYDAQKWTDSYTHLGLSLQNIIVIHNPLTLIPGQPSQGTSKRFLAVGRMSHLHKGFDLLIDAFHIFTKTNKDWMLDIVGEGPEEQMLRKKIDEYGLQQRVYIHPFTSNIQEYYSHAQIYVLSSRWEGFGLVLVEAMAHGLPVVSSDLPTSKEIMGTFGLYFKNVDIEDLAEKLYDVTQIDWKKKSEEALVITQRFDLSNIAKQWKEIL